MLSLYSDFSGSTDQIHVGCEYEYCINCLIHQSLGVAMHCWAYTDMVPSWISVIMGRPPELANCSVIFSDLSWSMVSVFPKLILPCLNWKIVIKILWKCLIVSCVIDPVYFSRWNLFTFISIIKFWWHGVWSQFLLFLNHNNVFTTLDFTKHAIFGGIIFVQHL